MTVGDVPLQSRHGKVIPASPARPHWAAVWSLAVVVAVLNASEVLPGSLLPVMSSSLGVSEGLVGQSVTATAVLAIVTSLAIAPLSQRVNCRSLLLILGGLMMVSNLVVALAPNPTVLLAARVVLGATVGGVWGLAPSLARRLVPSGAVPRAMTIIFGAASVAMVAAAPLGAFFGELVGWRGVFLAVTVISAAAVLAQALLFPSLPPHGTSRTTGMAHTLGLPWLAPGLVGVLLFWGGAQSFNTYLRPYLETVTGLDTEAVILVLLLIGIANFVGILIAAPVMQKSVRVALPLTAAGQTIALALLVTFGQAWWAAVLCPAAWALFVGMAGVGWFTWIARSYPDHAEPAGGLLVAAIHGSILLGALGGGVLIDHVDASAPLTAAVIVLAAASIYGGAIMRASAPVTSP